MSEPIITFEKLKSVLETAIEKSNLHGEAAKDHIKHVVLSALSQTLAHTYVKDHETTDEEIKYKRMQLPTRII